MIRDLARVHDHEAAVALDRDLDHLGVGEARHVVQDRGAQLGRDAGHLRVAGVDGHDGARSRELADDWHHAPGLLLRVDRRKPGTRGLAAHVNDVGPVVEQLHTPLDGLVGGVVDAAVGEGVGRHVEHAHDARTRQRQLVGSAAPRRAVLSQHMHHPFR